MPLFNKKFESKPIPVRSGRCNIDCPPVTEELDDYRSISLKLDTKEFHFADGIWFTVGRKNGVNDMIRLNRRIKILEEQVNVCNLKIEVLLDLLAEQVTEFNSLQISQKLRKY